MCVMVFGTFDNLHPGHLNYFQQARRFGEKLMKGAKEKGGAVKSAEAKNGVELIAVVARDKNVLRIKGQAAQEDEKTRVKKVRAALKEMKGGRLVPAGKAIFSGKAVFGAQGCRGKAVLGALKNQWTVLKKYRPDIICLGYDQKIDLRKLKGEIAKFHLCCKIKRMKAYHPDKYKSSYCRGNN